MKFNNEQIELIRDCKSAEELVEKAAAAGTSISLEQAGKILSSREYEEIGEDSLENVSGGCGTTQERTCYWCKETFDYELPLYEKDVNWGAKSYVRYCDSCAEAKGLK